MSFFAVTLLAMATKELVSGIYEDGAAFFSGSKQEVPENLAEKINHYVIGHAAASAVAALAAGLLPGAGALVAAGIAVGAIWAMYIKINSLCGIPFRKNLLKSLASAIVANITTAIAGMIAVDVLVSFIPGFASFTEAVVNFATVYVAGIIYIKLLTKIVKKYGGNFAEISEEELKATAKEVSDDVDIKRAAKEAKDIFKDMKKDGSLETLGKEFDINPEEDEQEEANE